MNSDNTMSTKLIDYLPTAIAPVIKHVNWRHRQSTDD